MASATNVRTRARQILNDLESSAYRWSNSVLDKYVDDAVSETWRLRADAFLTSAGTCAESIAALNSGWEGPLSEFVASTALGEDNADVGDIQRSEGLMASYMRFAVGNQG